MVSEHAYNLHSVARQHVQSFSLYGTGTWVPDPTLCCGTVLSILPGTHPLLCPQQLPQLSYAGAPCILRRLQLHLKPPRLCLLVLLDKRQLQQFHTTQVTCKPPIFARSSSSVPTTAVVIHTLLQTSWPSYA